MSNRWLIPVAVLAAWSAGCSMKQSPTPGSFRATDTAGKVPAIVDAAERDDPASLGELVHALDDEDPAVRLFAIRSLTQRTGQDFGYKYYQTVEQRRVASQRWQRWLDGDTGADDSATAGVDTP